MSKILVIDPGHGGHDPGATANGLREKDLTLDISKRIKKHLEDNYTGIKIYLTRTTDKYLTLSQRAQFANSKNADLFVSVHVNAGGGVGFESFAYNRLANTSNTVKMQNTIHNEIVRTTKWRDRGKKKANFAVLRETRMAAVLTENGFIDTVADANKLKQSSFKNKIAKGHAVGIVKAFNLKGGSGSTSTSKPSKPKPKPSKKPSTPSKSTYTGDSIVDYLKSIGQPSSFAHRKKLASKHGIKGYVGTASQNTRLLNALRGDKPSTTTKTTTTKQYTPKSFRVGQKVKIKSSAKKYSRSNVTIPSKYKNKTMTIQQVGKNDVLIKELYSWINKSDLK